MVPHEIPTHLDVPDKLVFGLTARQALAIGLSLCLGYVCYQHVQLRLWGHSLWLVPLALRIVALGVCGLGGVVIAFVRPLGRPLESWLLVVLRYHRMSKRYHWQRVPDAGMPPDTRDLDQVIAGLASTPHEHETSAPSSRWVGRFAPSYEEVVHGGS